MKTLIIGKRFQRWVMSLLLPAFAFLGSPIQANPTGGVVVHGIANINQVSASHLNINQQSQSAIINWNDFSIAAGELTSFTQPNSSASVLNRVTSGNISQIHGMLQGNGNVFVVNPNGIVVGASGVVDVGGMTVLSTLDIDDHDFLDGGANRFYGDSDTGVSNMGVISSANGDVILLGGFVDNQGQIGALNGTVALGAGGDILLQEAGGSKISVRGASDYTGTGVNNDGVVQGASAELKSHGNVFALAINNGGAVRASGATRANGRVRLTSSGTSSNINLGRTSSISATTVGQGGDVAIDAGTGDVTVGGTVDAVGTVNGGTVSVVGNNVTQSVDSRIDVSGGTNGGGAAIDAEASMDISGSIHADGTYGDGGDVKITGQNIVIDDQLEITANGMVNGGEVRIGGDFQGRDTGMREAETVGVGRDVTISVDSELGDAGTAIVWSNDSTIFLGEISAQSKGIIGNGGLIEVSGKLNLYYDGIANAGALNGESGTVLFDPGDVTVGATGTPPDISNLGNPGSKAFSSNIAISSVNDTLQGGTHVLIVTDSGRIVFEDQAGGGFDGTGNAQTDRHLSVQWTNSNASFGAFASESIFVNNHIRTSGGGSISLLAGWGGHEEVREDSDVIKDFDPQTAWDFYMNLGAFGEGGGSVIVGSNDMNRHVIVGSRFGDTNVSGFNVQVYGSDTQNYNRFGQIGFNDMGNVFAPRLDNGGGIVLDLSRGVGRTGDWYLSDGLNDAQLENNVMNESFDNIPVSGVGDPIVAIVGRNEVDMNGDGIMDGVYGVNSSGVRTDTFVPYANHYDSAGYGNWWWQQIEDAGNTGTKDPRGLGGLRPEHGAGIGDHSTRVKAADITGGRNNGADINVIARGNVLVEGGSGREHTSAMIGHGGNARAAWGGVNGATRETGSTNVTDARFSDAGIEGGRVFDAAGNLDATPGQLERRWSTNGSLNDRIAHSIGRLGPVYGNINVLAGVDPTFGVNVSHLRGTVRATVGTGGNIVVRAANGDFETGSESFNSWAQIGHGGTGQFGEYYGDIHVEAGGSVLVDAGNATRSHAAIGHSFSGHAYWQPPSNEDQQIRFFATTGDFDNPNLRRGELFTGRTTTGFNPGLDPLNQELAIYNSDTIADSNGDPLVIGAGGDPLSLQAQLVAIGKVTIVADGAKNLGTLVQEWNDANPTKRLDNNSSVAVNSYIPPADAEVVFTSAINRRDSDYINTTGNPNNDAQLYTGVSRAPLTLAPVGPVAVEAIDGSTISGFHGNVTVKARAGDVRVKGYDTDVQPGDMPVNGAGQQQERGRDRRFAGIGHGGSNFSFWTEGSGYDGSARTQDIATFDLAVPGVTGNVQISSVETGIGPVRFAGDGATNLNGLISNWNSANPGAQITLTSANGADIPNDGEVINFSSTVATLSLSEGREVVVWEVGDEVSATNTTGSRSVVGNQRTERPRSLQMMTITGNIDVEAGGDVSVVAGNDVYDYARIGHGGVELADMETSSFILGDIQVKAGGNLLVQGGGEVVNNARFDSQRNFDMHAWAIIGHGGFRNGFMGYDGDIDVDVDGTVTVRGGAYTNTLAKIGHQTWEDYGQSGGDFVRTENFLRDENFVDIETSLTSTEAKVEYEFTNTTPFVSNTTTMATEVRDFTNTGAGTAIGERNTANITVRAGLGVTVDQLEAGIRETPAQTQYEIDNPTAAKVDTDSQGEGHRSRNSYAMIGHGGDNAESLNEFNVNANYGDKVGDISVTADTGDIILQSSNGQRRWTRIGHGFDDGRANGTSTVYSRSIELAGNISVIATTGSISVDASAAAESEREYPDDPEAALFGSLQSQENAVAIGHGSVINGLDIVVLSNGELINGIAASSDITVTAGQNLEVLGGNAVQASHAQIGHGFASDLGNDASRRFNQYVGFAGDINVTVGNDLTLKGGENSWVKALAAIDNVPIGVSGAFAAIGHGGYQLDAPSSGDITVYVGNNASILGQVRTDAATTLPTNTTAFYIATNAEVGPNSGSAGSAFNFAKIGHFAVENSQRNNNTASNGDIVQNASQTGNVTVVIGNDLTMRGGTTPDIDSQPIYGAFAQIGNGGPGAAGDLDGNLTVLVKGNIDLETGMEMANSTAAAARGLTRNNYVMIGNGDLIVNPGGTPGSLFRTEGIGFRTGDIVVAAGNDASFSGSLVGHNDPVFSSQTTIGNTQVAVSRLNPFFGGPGILETSFSMNNPQSRTVFTGDTLQFFMPARANNQMDMASTSLNGSSYTGGFLTNFAADPGGGFDTSLGELAGRGDEVYLTPDLWWDELGLAAVAGFPGGDDFPTDATSGQGGAIAEVNGPGGIVNLDALVAGALGTSATTSNTAFGNYTVYYDAIIPVSNVLPPLPGPPFVPFFRDLNIASFFYRDLFDSFTRDDRFVSDEYAGADDFLLAALGLFELDEDESEESGSRRFENSLDNLFGSRRASYSEEEEDEEKRNKRKRGQGPVGTIGLTFYVFEPGTNRLSSYFVFGNSLETFIPQN